MLTLAGCSPNLQLGADTAVSCGATGACPGSRVCLAVVGVCVDADDAKRDVTPEIVVFASLDGDTLSESILRVRLTTANAAYYRIDGDVDGEPEWSPVGAGEQTVTLNDGPGPKTLTAQVLNLAGRQATATLAVTRVPLKAVTDLDGFAGRDFVELSWTSPQLGDAFAVETLVNGVVTASTPTNETFLRLPAVDGETLTTRVRVVGRSEDLVSAPLVLTAGPRVCVVGTAGQRLLEYRILPDGSLEQTRVLGRKHSVRQVGALAYSASTDELVVSGATDPLGGISGAIEVYAASGDGDVFPRRVFGAGRYPSGFAIDEKRDRVVAIGGQLSSNLDIYDFSTGELLSSTASSVFGLADLRFVLYVQDRDEIFLIEKTTPSDVSIPQRMVVLAADRDLSSALAVTRTLGLDREAGMSSAEGFAAVTTTATSLIGVRPPAYGPRQQTSFLVYPIDAMDCTEPCAANDYSLLSESVNTEPDQDIFVTPRYAFVRQGELGVVGETNIAYQPLPLTNPYNWARVYQGLQQFGARTYSAAVYDESHDRLWLGGPTSLTEESRIVAFAADSPQITPYAVIGASKDDFQSPDGATLLRGQRQLLVRTRNGDSRVDGVVGLTARGFRDYAPAPGWSTDYRAFAADGDDVFGVAAYGFDPAFIEARRGIAQDSPVLRRLVGRTAGLTAEAEHFAVDTTSLYVVGDQSKSLFRFGRDAAGDIPYSAVAGFATTISDVATGPGPGEVSVLESGSARRATVWVLPQGFSNKAMALRSFTVLSAPFNTHFAALDAWFVVGKQEGETSTLEVYPANATGDVTPSSTRDSTTDLALDAWRLLPCN